MSPLGLKRFAAPLLFSAALYAQVETGRIIGTIKDAAGALVPRAEVTITNTQTNQSFSTQSREDGTYESVPIRIGTYRVVVEHEGFRRSIRDGIILQIQQTVVVDHTLELGQVTQEISITAAAPLLATTEATQGQVIDNKKMVDLPLNGRDYIQLALLSAGANQAAPTARTGGFSGSGMRSTQNNYLMDGVDNNNAQIAVQGRQGEAVKPNVDAIQEFKVMTNAYSAEYSRAAGAVVSVSLKSGTNELHGTAYEFLRNEKLDARNFFDLPDQPRVPFKRNQFGFSLGGPVRKDRTFFFGDYEWMKIRESRTLNNTIPTPQMVRGDFSELLPATRLYDPATYSAATGRQLFAGNVIPGARFDPIGEKVASFYPAPNKPGLTRNFLYNPPDSSDRDRWDIKIDHMLNSRNNLTGRYSYQRDYEPPDLGLPAPAYNGGSDYRTPGHNAMLGYNRIFTPTLVLSAKGAWNAISTLSWPPVDRSLNAEIGLKGVDITTPGMAPFSVSGYSGLGIGSTLDAIPPGEPQ